MPYICTYNGEVGFEWDADKARENVRKHRGVRFEESKAVFEDPYAITIVDDASDELEKRFVTIGVGGLGRVLSLCTHTARRIFEIISARVAARRECDQYEKGLP